MSSIISAIFKDRRDAEKAVEWLRERGAPDEAVTVIARSASDHVEHPVGSVTPEGETVADVMDRPGSDTAAGAAIGAGAGAGVGALFGLAAVLIPGAGPFITAGALASLLGGAGATLTAGALVGATAGSFAGVFNRWGLTEEESHHYADEVERGGTYVGVDLDRAHLNHRDVATAFARFNGERRGGDTEAHPLDSDQVATGTLAGPAAVSEGVRLRDTVEHHPPSQGNVLATDSTAGYVTGSGHYDPVISADTGEHRQELLDEMQAPVAEDCPRSSAAEEDEEEAYANRHRLA